MFDRLFKFIFPSANQNPPKFQALILEPILTPSAIVEVEDLFDGDVPDGDIFSSLGDDLEDIPFAPSQSVAFESGYFTVGEGGEVGIDFLFDSGKYQFELAIFSLEDLDETPGSEEFIREAARRALTDTTEGYTVISDRFEGARFDGDLGEGKDWNSGDYLGVKTFKMEAGTQFGIMLVPNGTIEDVYENPSREGDKAPLFSLSTANPDDALHLGQIADATGEGNTFVMEDVQQGHKWFDRDYNDLIFQVRGATGEAIAMDEVVDPSHDWRETEMGEAILDYVTAYEETDNVGMLPATSLPDASIEDRPLVGIIDTGFSDNNPDFDYDNIQTGRDWIDGDENPFIAPKEGNEAGTHRMGMIGATPDNDFGIDGIDAEAPLWLGRADALTWSDSLTEFVDAAIESEQPHAVVNLSFPFVDGDGNTRYELTLGERDAIAYARENGVILVVAVGDDGGIPSALAQASREFDNIITVGSSEGIERADYSNFGESLDILTDGGTEENPVVSTLGSEAGTMAGTGVAASRLTGAISQVWAANPDLSYQQVIDILGKTARDLGTWGEDGETGSGLLNIAAAVNLAAATNASTYKVSEELEEIEYIEGSGNSSDRPSPEPNYLPHNLNFVIDRFYNPTEAVSLAGKLSDRNGTQDLQRIEFWLQKDGGEWEQLEDVKEFIPQRSESALFARNLGILAPGNYRLQALAYDSSNVGWEMETKAFTVLSTPEGRELSSRVKRSLARALDLSSYDPHFLQRTQEWVVSVQAGQSAADLAAAIGAVNLGATGRIPNTHTWRFPEGMDATAIAALLDRKGIEFAYPLVSKRVDFYTPTDSEPLVTDGTQWHLQSNGNFDANISQVWKNHGVSGEGVEIGIVDSGFAVEDGDRNLQTHSDLRPNYNPDLSYDFDEGDNIPSAVLQATAGLSGLKPIYPGTIGYKFASAIHGSIANLSVDLAIDHPQSQDFTVTLVYRRSQLDPNPPIEIPLELDSTGKVSRIITELNGESALGKDWVLLIENPSAEMGYLQHLQLNFETENHHGTKVAGVAAASGSNGIGGSGVASGAEWAGLRMGADGLSADEAFSALSHEGDIIDIYNNSWGLAEIFTTLPDGEDAIEQGVENGRGGLGNIYVFAAGNNQKDEEGARYGNVNYNSFANSRHTIAVAAIDHQGKQATYSAPGAPLLVSAHSSSGTKDGSDRPIVTTNDYDNDYTIASYSETGEDFGGTSSAAPLVSGVIALMLEANPHLTYRDVQAILLKTAQMNDPSDRYTEPEREHEGWYQNGGGYWINPKYGFGAVDANAAVELAKNWTPLPPYDTVTATVSPIFDLIPDLYEDEPDTGETLVSTLTIPPTDDMQVEWVEVEFLGNHQYQGDLEIVLVSPDGTRSVLAESHRDTLKYAQTHSPTSYDWTFTSVRHWGESAAGEWRLEVTDKEYGGAYDYPQYYEQHNFLAQWKLNVYGTKSGDKAPIPDNSWIRQLGTTGSDRASGVTVDDNGNVYVVGSTHGNLDGNTHSGNSDPFITKYDPEGNKLWTQQVGSTGFDYYTEVAVDEAGNIYAIGYGPENAGDGDIKFVKYDAEGNLLWDQLIGTTNHEWSSGLKIDPDGNVVLTGWTQDTYNDFESADAFVAKYNSDGEQIWIEQKGTAAADRGLDVAIDADGNIYTVGITEGDLGNTNAGESDIFVTKYDIDGNEVWTKQYGTTTAESSGLYNYRSVSVDVDSNGNVYISGETDGDLNGQTNHGSTDVFAMKLDENGEEVWTRQMEGTGRDHPKGIRLDKEGNVYIAGWTNSTVNGEFNTGQSAFWVKYDSDGNLLDTEVIATSQQDIAMDIEIDRSGNVYLAGYTQGDLGAENAGDRDFWVSKNYVQPSVTITTNQTTVNENGDPVSITISRTGETDKPLTVNLDIAGSAINGDDFEALPETVEIPAGQSSITILLTPKDDSVYEGDESIAIALSDGIGYKSGEDNAIVFNLIDDETLASVTIESVIPVVSEDGFAALFEITREGGDETEALTVNLDISGTAIKGIDYQDFPNTVTIPADKDSVFLFVKPLEDNEYEGNETVVVNLANGTGYEGGINTSSSVTIIDNDPQVAPLPVLSLRATDAIASEDGDAAQFIVERTGDTSEDLTVHYSLAGEAVNGEDYLGLTETIVIPAGETIATIPIVPLHDYDAEGDESVLIDLSANSAYEISSENSAVATLLNSTKTSRYGSFVYVNPDNGHLYILSENDTWLGAQEQAEALGGNLVTINDQAENDWLVDTFGNQIFSIGLTDSEIYGQQEGDFSWVNGESLNYTNWKAGEPNNIIAGNEDFAVINQFVTGTWNDRIETGDFPGIIEIDPAELDKPIVNFMVTDDEAGEDGNAGQIVVTRVGNLDEDLTVNYRLSGDATNGVDYEQLPETIVIPAGQSLATIPIIPVGDLEFEQNETVVVKLADGEYDFGTHRNAEIEIVPQSPVNRISNEVIGRDVSTLDYWENLLLSGVSPEQLRKDIIAAAIDTQGNFQAEEKIKEMYRDILQREATSQEVAEGRSQLENGATLSQLRQNLAGIVPLIDTLNPVYINPDTGSKYFLTRSDTWLGAQEQAEALGGNLVSINSESENQWLVDTFGSGIKWIGATDSPIFGNDEGEYQWVNGEAIAYSNWSPGNPDNWSGAGIEGEDFGHLNFGASTTVGLWNDFKADHFHMTGIVEIPNEAGAGYDWTWTYFGEDFNPNGNDAPLTNTPNSDKARNEFLANLENVKIENFESYADASVPTTLNFGDETATVSGIRSIRDFSTGGYNGDGTYPISGDKYMFHYAESKTIKIDFENPQSAFGFSTTDAGDGGSQVIVTLHREDGSTEDLIVPHGQGGINWGEATFFGVTDLENPFVAVTLTNTNYEHDGFGIDDLIIGDIKPETILNASTPPNETLHLAYYEDTPLNLSDILVTDPDGEATVKLTLSRPTEGILTPATSGNVTSTYDPVTGVWQASGNVADLNQLLADLQFIPRDNAYGDLDIATEITVGNDTHTGAIALTGIGVNDDPTLTITPNSLNQTYIENIPLDLNGIFVNDIDAADTLTVTLTLDHANAGTLSSNTANNASTTFTDGVLTVSGSIGDVNAILADLQFNPATNYNQDITIATTVTDGNSNPIPGQTITLKHLNPTIVTNTNDRGIGSLRYALEWANQHNPGTDTITFAIPTTDIGYNPTTGTFTIQPLSALPEIQDPAILNATSQNGFNGTPIVEIDGSLAGDGADGFTIATSDSTIRGFAINRFNDSAIDFQNGNNSTIVGNYLGTDITGTLDLGNQGSGISGRGAGNIIGGMNAGDRNLISGNKDGGVYISMSDTQVINNYIGTDITGQQDLGNAFGVRFHHGSNNLLQNNLISGNDSHGVSIDGGGSANNIVRGNFIGTNADGTQAIANGRDGIKIEGKHGSRNHIIGGTTPEAHNLISGNLLSGINIQNSSGNTVQGNYIGKNADLGIRLFADNNAIGGLNAGEGNIISGNYADGIYMAGSDNNISGNAIEGNGDDGIQIGQDEGPANNNTVSDNAIAFNQGSGIYLSQGTENTFSENSIHDNAWAGIDFKPGYNTNESQPAPTLTYAFSDGTATVIEGTLNADLNTTYRVEFFSDKDGEGKTFLGWQNVTTDGNGNASVANNLPNVAIGEFITATAIDPAGNTSMFGAVEVIDVANFIPLNHWNASFINRTYPSTGDRNTFDFSNPVATLDLGEQAENGKLSLTRNWGDGSPDPAVQTDQYAMRAWTRTQFEAGQLYKITTRSDDGVWFHLKNAATGEWVGDSVVVSGDGADWRDRGIADAPRTIFFKVPESGEYDFHVDYYENTGGSVVDFTLEEAQPFQDFVNPQTQWETEFYWWDRKLGNQPPADIFANGGDPSSKIGTANLGSNVHSNGKSGLSFNWGANAALNDVRLPDNNYAILARTQATLEAGRNYQMHIQGDDGFQILARNRTTGQETFITPENQWQQAYGAHQVVQFSVPSDGQYDIEAQFYEERGDAYFDLSWEPINFSGSVISTINSNLREGPSTAYPIVGQVWPGANLTFDKWTHGQFIDYTNQLGTATSLWYRIAGTNQWISGALINGSP